MLGRLEKNRDRATLEFCKKEFKKTGNIGYLRQEIELLNNQASYVFDFSADEKAPKHEQRQQRLDAFVASDVIFALVAETVGKEGGAIMHQYANPIVFPTGAGFVNEDLDAMFANSKIEIANGSVIIAKNMDMMRFRNVAQSQQTGANNRTEFDINSAKQAIEPYLILSGNSKPSLTVKLPLFNGAAFESKTPGVKYKLVCYLSGIHLEGWAARVDAALAARATR